MNDEHINYVFCIYNFITNMTTCEAFKIKCSTYFIFLKYLLKDYDRPMIIYLYKIRKLCYAVSPSMDLKKPVFKSKLNI